MRCREENGSRQYERERGEHAQTQPVNHHRRVLPVAGQLGAFVVGPQARRHRPQLAEDCLQQAAAACRRSRARSDRGPSRDLRARPDQRPPRPSSAVPVVEGRKPAGTQLTTSVETYYYGCASTVIGRRGIQSCTTHVFVLTFDPLTSRRFGVTEAGAMRYRCPDSGHGRSHASRLAADQRNGNQLPAEKSHAETSARSRGQNVVDLGLGGLVLFNNIRIRTRTELEASF